MLIPPGETIIETKSCKLCGAVFHITDKDLEFYDKVSPVFKGKKESIPTPTFCPDCRQQRRCVFLNQRNLYVRPCDATGKTIVSQYQPSARHPVYDVDYWHSDAWDPLGYGRSFDFSSSFFGQFEELFFSVPRPSRWVTFNENCDYMNGGAYNRDCYLIFNGSHNERCYYSLGIARCSHCMDSTRISSSEGLYECVEASGCFRCFFCRAIQNSSDCWYSLACGSCRHCFGCVNLVNAQYAIFNETHSPEEYHRRVDALLALDPLQLRKMIADHFGKYPRRFADINQSENVIGNVLLSCKNAFHCFECENLENGKWCL
ncbi:MAG TPA: hypothetical protein PK765_04240 [bacterium]|nr:hypothetical protein [bacterium]